MNRIFVYLPAVAIVLTLAVLLIMALPEATQKIRAGLEKQNEVACDVLNATPGNQQLGKMPVRAPDFALKNYAGQEIRLSQLRGNVVVINFWATWCTTCVVEMPSMEKLVDKLKGKAFRLLAVSVDDDWPAIRKFFEKGTPLEILLDEKRAIPKMYGTEKFPETFIVDKQGMIRYFVVSDRDWSQPAVQHCIDSLIREG